jgi:hypothetical protein
MEDGKLATRRGTMQRPGDTRVLWFITLVLR